MFISSPNRHLENLEKPKIKTFLLETENPNDSMVVRLLVDITQLDYELEISIA